MAAVVVARVVQAVQGSPEPEPVPALAALAEVQPPRTVAAAALTAHLRLATEARVVRLPVVVVEQGRVR